MLSAVSSSLASVSSLSNPSLRVFIRYLKIMFRQEAINETFYLPSGHSMFDAEYLAERGSAVNTKPSNSRYYPLFRIWLSC
jgi:hypothetical protein